MSQISQLSKLAIAIVASTTVTFPPTTSPCSSATKSRGLPYHFVIGWCGAFFPTIGKGVPQFWGGFFACKHFLLGVTIVREAHFDCFFLLQTPANVTVMFARTWTLLFISPVLLGLSTRCKKWYTV